MIKDKETAYKCLKFKVLINVFTFICWAGGGGYSETKKGREKSSLVKNSSCKGGRLDKLSEKLEGVDVTQQPQAS